MVEQHGLVVKFPTKTWGAAHAQTVDTRRCSLTNGIVVGGLIRDCMCKYCCCEPVLVQMAVPILLILVHPTNYLQPVRMWNVKTRKRLVLLQSLAVLMAVLQYGLKAAGQDEGGNPDRILSNAFHHYLTAT